MSGLTLGLIKLWEPPVLVAALFGLLGLITSVKFAIDYSEEQDRKTFRWYEVSGYILCTAFPHSITLTVMAHYGTLFAPLRTIFE